MYNVKQIYSLYAMIILHHNRSSVINVLLHTTHHANLIYIGALSIYHDNSLNIIRDKVKQHTIVKWCVSL